MLGDRFLTPRDKEVFKKSNYGGKLVFGPRAALIVVDFTYEFLGFEREPILDAIRKIPTACGSGAWEALDSTRRILSHARTAGALVVYTKFDRTVVGPFAKKKRSLPVVSSPDAEIYSIAKEIAPQPGDEVIAKLAPSAFFGTNLAYLLISQGIDTVLITGGTISGCVRATATDAFSYGYQVAVVQDAVYDRGEASGEMSLFDLNAKYADIIDEGTAISYFDSVCSVTGG